jgi:hypothetical protein
MLILELTKKMVKIMEENKHLKSDLGKYKYRYPPRECFAKEVKKSAAELDTELDKYYGRC